MAIIIINSYVRYTHIIIMCTIQTQIYLQYNDNNKIKYNKQTLRFQPHSSVYQQVHLYIHTQK